MKKLSLSLLVMLLVAGLASQAFCADIAGRVFDAEQHPVAGMRVLVETPNGKVVAQAVTDSNGFYRITNLPPGNYHLELDTGSTGFLGQTVVAPVGAKGLTVDWAMCHTMPATAFAAPPAPLVASRRRIGGFILLPLAAVTGLGIAAGVGTFSGPPSPPGPPPPPPPPHSPSL